MTVEIPSSTVKGCYRTYAARAVALVVALCVPGLAADAAGPTRLRAHPGHQGEKVEQAPPGAEGTTLVISNPGYLEAGRRGQRSTAPGAEALVVGKGSPIAPLEVLAPALAAERDRVSEIETWNTVPGRPLKDGFLRALGEPHAVTVDAAALDAERGDGRFAGGLVAEAKAGMVAWTAEVRVADAERMRLHLSEVALPAGSAVWTYGEDLVPQGPVGTGLATREDGLWCPSVTGGAAWIEVQIPAASLARGERASFVVDGALEIFRLDEEGSPLALHPEKQRGDGSCLVDVDCVSPTDAISNASKGVGRILFVSGGSSFVCTGGLVNDQASSGTPYFLTANHCFHSQAEAASAEVWFDYKRSGCGGALPNESTLPKSFGGTFLVAGEASDFSLLQLSDVPAGRFFFGWRVGDPGDELLQRVSNPFGGLQKYSETRSNNGRGEICSGVPLSGFLYQSHVTNGVAGGSSGSPVWTGDDFIVGQLFGICGRPDGTSCDSVTSTIDGRFSATFPSVSLFLTPGAPRLPANLRASKTKKKKVQLNWDDAATDETAYEVAVFRDDVWTTVASLPAGSKTAAVKMLAPGTAYRLGVRACRDATCSAYAEVTVTTKGH